MPSPCSLRAFSRGVLEMEQGAAPAHRSRTPGPGRPSGLHLGANLRAPRQELADVQVANGLDEKRGPRTEIAAVERREARRSAWTGNLRRTGDRPDREAGQPGAAAIRTSAVSALRPLASGGGKYRKPRARMRRENAVGCLKFESGNS